MMGKGSNEENEEEGVITCLHAIESEVLTRICKSQMSELRGTKLIN